MITIQDAQEDDLLQILDLQSRNLKINLTPEEAQSEGFVTLIHSLELLQKMNHPFAHTIAKDGNKVIGYALTLLSDVKSDISELNALYEAISDVDNFVVMGQVCIEKSYRGRGVFRSMYERMNQKFTGSFDYIITEVSESNRRSLEAHYAIGFSDLRIRPGWRIIWKEIDKSQ
ncbi:GNAT family N-acetyltransferase [Portibacter marinus]|uniref:GNAT family N-acetyltransferase n=1 Tax=Portibacter marinus TaxID=2898660 RepID=UPI001F2156AF|nr:GNAT family N-acetyltransferase [Portibacter marinus]